MDLLSLRQIGEGVRAVRETAWERMVYVGLVLNGEAPPWGQEKRRATRKDMDRLTEFWEERGHTMDRVGV